MGVSKHGEIADAKGHGVGPHKKGRDHCWSRPGWFGTGGMHNSADTPRPLMTGVSVAGYKSCQQDIFLDQQIFLVARCASRHAASRRLAAAAGHQWPPG